MNKENLKQDILEIFDISESDADGESNDYGTSSDAVAPSSEFDELVGDMSERVTAEEPVVSEKPEPESEPEPAKNEEKVEEVTVEEGESTEKAEEDISSDGKDPFDLESSITESTEEQQVSQEPEDSQDESATEIAGCKGKSIVNSDSKEIQWLLDCPDAKYERFYQHKREAIRDFLLPGGPLPFEKLLDEIKKIRIDLDVRTYDKEAISNQMRLVQQWRERVHEVFMSCLNQCKRWDTFVPRLEGVLARINYEKPKDRQEGVIYEHMRDMDLYYADLKTLEVGAGHLLQHLDKATDVLSRQLTVALDNERFSPQGKEYAPNKPKESSAKGLDGFDSLEEGETAEPRKKGSQYRDWDKL
jgi:hypothetical protein